MQGKENIPNLEKNTKISFPLINPEPITVPKIASEAKKQSFMVYNTRANQFLETFRRIK